MTEKQKYNSYICDDCAKTKGGVMPSDSCNTYHYDTCPYCNEPNKTLCATTDYAYPKLGKKAIWD